MKKQAISIIIILFGLFFLQGCKKDSTDIASIIPKPNNIKLLDGVFTITKSTTIVLNIDSNKTVNIANYFNSYLDKVLGYRLKIIGASNSTNDKIVFEYLDNKSLGKEGYNLLINENGIIIKGNYAGQFYAIQSLLQLLPSQIYGNKLSKELKLEVPFVKIEDIPRFEWRGMHLDVSRHMFSVDSIKKYIDYLAFHKLNTFHWHLTDDQGWRIEIKKYPKLAEVSGYRNETIIGHHNSNPQKFDGEKYGGFYTQDEIRNIVKYAADRFITVVPEIEMPGHAIAALAAYPGLSCTGGPFEVRTSWGISDDIYCAGNEKTFEFLENVLSEVVELFPSKYIHIGGDEAPKVRWEKCDKCQRRIKENNLNDEHELQSYFITRIEKYLNSKGKQIIGWDEILEGGLAPNAAVMSWRGNEGGIAAAKSKHKVVMSPTSFCYFDYYQTEKVEEEPLAIGGYLPIEKVYSFNPVPLELTTEEAQYIIGVQANVWTEYMPSFKQVEYMAFPRMSALAEIAWTKDSNKNFIDFNNRMDKQNNRFDALKINYFTKKN